MHGRIGAWSRPWAEGRAICCASGATCRMPFWRMRFSPLSRCSKLIAIKLCAISAMHAKVRRGSVAGYATDETLVCGPKEHTRWWQRYRCHLQVLLYRLILNSYLSRCSKLIAIKLCAISAMHAKVRRESVAGYATDETLVCGPKEHTRWWQRYRCHLQVLLYRLILNSYLLLIMCKGLRL